MVVVRDLVMQDALAAAILIAFRVAPILAEGHAIVSA